MAQNFPSSPQIIYDTLTADSVFTNAIGSYEFKGNSTPVPAVTITTPGADLPSIKSVNGIEVIIHDTADFRRIDRFDASDLIADWTVFVICWNPATGDDMNIVVKRVMEIFSGATSYQTVAVSSGIDANVQTSINIPSDKPILTP